MTSATEQAPLRPGRWHEAFSTAEIRDLVRMRDWRSWLTLAVDWGLIAGAMALAASWPNPLTIVVAIVIIGTRQLGLAVIVHEAAHRSFFSKPRTNDGAVSWLACYPIWSDLYGYRRYHLRHHAKTWTDDDPDLALATPFPISRASFWRKVGRDLSGRSGLKFLRFAAQRDLGSERMAAVGRVEGAAKQTDGHALLDMGHAHIALVRSNGAHRRDASRNARIRPWTDRFHDSQ